MKLAEKGTLPLCRIVDEPAFSYRGFMIDSARHMQTIDEIKKYILAAAEFKLNVFHWHLSEDQGFRAQILDKLLLTEIGSYRSHTNFNTRKHEGYYTVDDMKEIVDYAHNLCIKVVPEIDTPGHAVAMIAAYPELSCFDRKLEVATHWGIKHDVLCIGKESTFEFIQTVFDELLEIFTDGMFHIGGDEARYGKWRKCPKCQEKMKEKGIKNERHLQMYFMGRVNEMLRHRGKTCIAWNDCLGDELDKNIITAKNKSQQI